MSLAQRPVIAWYSACFATRTLLMHHTFGSKDLLEHRFFIDKYETIQYVVQKQPPWLVLTSHDLLADAQLADQIRIRPTGTRCIFCVLPDAPPLPALLPLATSAVVDVLCTLAELPSCLTAAAAQQYYVSSLLQHAVISATATAHWQPLTFSEKRVLTELLSGRSRGEAAETLCISPRTVDNHKASSAAKLQVASGPHGFVRFLEANKATLQGWLGAAN